jgi:hypothetical protein
MRKRFATAAVCAVLPAFVALASAPVRAETQSSGASETSKSENKTQGHYKPSSSHQKAPHAAKPASVETKAGHYATLAEAQAHCRGRTVVWVDKDNFHHYEGSREFGRMPGSFMCE